jgi:hypothetical protein
VLGWEGEGMDREWEGNMGRDGEMYPDECVGGGLGGEERERESEGASHGEDGSERRVEVGGSARELERKPGVPIY